jgi:hypothetical protein
MHSPYRWFERDLLCPRCNPFLLWGIELPQARCRVHERDAAVQHDERRRAHDVEPPRCGNRQRVQSWRKLERGLLLAFKDEFGSVPLGNKQGNNSFWDDEATYFKPNRLRAIINQYSGS